MHSKHVQRTYTYIVQCTQKCRWVPTSQHIYLLKLKTLAKERPISTKVEYRIVLKFSIKFIQVNSE